LVESCTSQAVDWAAQIRRLHPGFEKSQLCQKEGLYGNLSEFEVDTFHSAGEAERLLLGTSEEVDVYISTTVLYKYNYEKDLCFGHRGEWKWFR
jgi:hypothetical protein